MKFFPRLHWLRGLLALSIVVCHLEFTARSAHLNVLARLGGSAIPVFFVLSGFVMFQVVSSTPEGFADALGFLVKRVLRIFPAYWFFLGLTAILVFYGGNTVDHVLNRPVRWVQGWLLFPADFGSMVGVPMLAAWSLIYEMLFYYILALVVCSRRIGLVVLIGYFGWALVPENRSPFPIFGVSTIADLFLAGLLLGAVNKHRPQILPKLTPLLFVGLALFLAYIFLNFSVNFAVPWGASVLVVAGVLGLEHSYKPRMHGAVQGALQFLGTISFSLYVGHTFTQTIVFDLLGPPTLLTVPVYIGAPVLVAFGSFMLIEKPCMNLAKWIDTRFILHRPVKDVPATKELEIAPSS